MSKLFNNFYKGKRVLITGHTGFKGSWLSIWLNSLGADVIGYALNPPSKPSVFEVCNLSRKITSIKGDIRDFRKLKAAFKKYKPEVIFHLAAQSLVRQSYKSPVETYQTNVIGTANILEASRQVEPVRVIVNVTSDKCYKNCGYAYSYKEDDKLGGYDPYSSSKACSELVTNSYLESFFNPKNYKKHHIALASARAGNVVGGGDWAEDRIIPDCIRAFVRKQPIILRYPNAIRPWQHVLEPLYGYLLLGKYLYKNGATFSGAWNFGPKERDVKPVKWLVEYVAKLWGDGVSWKKDCRTSLHEASCLQLNCSKARLKLGWHPQWDLKTALEKTVQCYKEYYKHNKMIEVILNQIQSYEKSLLSLYGRGQGEGE